MASKSQMLSKAASRPTKTDIRAKAAASSISSIEDTSSSAPAKKVNKGGRPTLVEGKRKKEYCKTINIAVPVDLLARLEVAKAFHQNNLTKYINDLIEEDLERNEAKYQQFKEMMNS